MRPFSRHPSALAAASLRRFCRHPSCSSIFPTTWAAGPALLPRAPTLPPRFSWYFRASGCRCWLSRVFMPLALDSRFVPASWPEAPGPGPHPRPAAVPAHQPLHLLPPLLPALRLAGLLLLLTPLYLREEPPGWPGTSGGPLETLAAFSFIPGSLRILYFRSRSFLSYLQQLFSKEVGKSFLALPWLRASPMFSCRRCRRTSTANEESGPGARPSAGAAMELKAAASFFTATDFLP
ncbi:unnamed protein product [Rangifer tarandus platyrhynchus]|uniref:Uncharacterized protein n=1 Tax=Rangifer tarandus platyrhynchus TaxID=3082113 RepID=A0ABN8ZCV3_RANTA|nr:unnamed protein product [Rangifer tarandus platyrhynchus]